MGHVRKLMVASSSVTFLATKPIPSTLLQSRRPGLPGKDGLPTAPPVPLLGQAVFFKATKSQLELL